MTIDSGWIKAMKQDFPQCFTRKCPFEFQSVFIDAQIKLPKADSVTTWQELIHRNFVRGIQKWFHMGARYVIVAFDDYNHVPKSKGMTQSKRRRNVPATDVNAYETLPPIIPGNYMELLMNRTYKNKVISLIVEYLPSLVDMEADQTLIIDWNKHAVHFRKDKEPIADATLPALGECDCKATRYARYGNLLIDTTDGDYIPICLTKLQQYVHVNREEVPQIAINRIECRIDTSVRKRVVSSSEHGFQRCFEFVYINKLYDAIIGKVRQCESPQTNNEFLRSLRGREMSILSVLIGCTGTDFTKGLPYISPKKIWSSMEQGIWLACATCYDRDTNTINIDEAADLVIARLYILQYKKHIHNRNAAMSEVSFLLKEKSTLSQFVRTRLPSTENVICLLKNVNWLLQYWACPEDGRYPDPMDKDVYGYCYNKKGKPMYADDM